MKYDQRVLLWPVARQLILCCVVFVIVETPLNSGKRNWPTY